MNRFGILEERDSEEVTYGNNYVVKKGDSLYKISKEFGVDINDLINVNDLKSNLIYPNQVLIIPKKVVGEGIYFEEYITKNNETLDFISQVTGVDIFEMSKYNDLGKLILVENQIINIPNIVSSYVIKEEDTIESILSMSDMTLEELIELNLTNWLKAGETIYIKN